MWIKPEDIKQTGWYWHEDRFGELEVVKIRRYGQDLAIGNCILIGGYNTSRFHGPIKEPVAT